MTSTSPGAVAPGKTIDLTLTGTKFDETLSVWASFTAKLELVPLADPKKPSATSRVCKVTIEPNVARTYMFRKKWMNRMCENADVSSV